MKGGTKMLFCRSDNPTDEEDYGHLNGDADGVGAYRGIINILILSLPLIIGILIGVNLLARFG